jgi:HEAT repeat protein
MDKDEVLMTELIKEVNNYGLEIVNYDELKAIKRTIKNAIPILLKYLNLFEGDNYTDATLRLLAVKGFNDATEKLLEIYNDKSSKIDKWVIGDVLYSIQDGRFQDEYIKIVRNEYNGISRQMIVILLGKLKCEKAIPTLVNLLQDDKVDGHAIMALGYFKNYELIKCIEPFLNHEKKWIQKEAAKAIKKIKG